MSTVATRWLSAVFNFAVAFASGIPYGLICLNFLLMGIFFLSARYRDLRERLMSLMGDSLRERSEQISGSAGQGLSGYIKVQLLYAALVLAVSTPALTLFGLPYAFLIAALAAILEFLPIFGNGTLYIPWAIIAYLIGMPQLGTQMLLLHLALFICRRLTEPKLMSNQMGLSPLLSLIAMFVGMQLGGVLGLILAPVVMVVILSGFHDGLFDATLRDLRHVISHIASRLREPAAAVTVSTPPDSPQAPASAPPAAPAPEAETTEQPPASPDR